MASPSFASRLRRARLKSSRSSTYRSAKRWACSTPSTASTLTAPGRKVSGSIAARTPRTPTRSTASSSSRTSTPEVSMELTASPWAPTTAFMSPMGISRMFPGECPRIRLTETSRRTTSCRASGTAMVSPSDACAPGGYVLRTDADGKEWELVLGGFRNAYDLRLQRRRRAVHLRQRYGRGLGAAVVPADPHQSLHQRRRVRLAFRHRQVARILPRQPAGRRSTSASARRPA